MLRQRFVPVVAGVGRAAVARAFRSEAPAKSAILFDNCAIVLDDRRLPAGAAFEGFIVARTDDFPARVVRFDISLRTALSPDRVRRFRKQVALRVPAEVHVDPIFWKRQPSRKCWRRKNRGCEHASSLGKHQIWQLSKERLAKIWPTEVFSEFSAPFTAKGWRDRPPFPFVVIDAAWRSPPGLRDQNW